MLLYYNLFKYPLKILFVIVVFSLVSAFIINYMALKRSPRNEIIVFLTVLHINKSFLKEKIFYKNYSINIILSKKNFYYNNGGTYDKNKNIFYKEI